MKIETIQNYNALQHLGSGHRSKSPIFREKQNSMNMCEEKNKGYYGSFTGKSEAAISFLDPVLKSNWFGRFAKYSNDHNISTSALIALVLAGVLRPATIMALPGKKDKEDKIYASGHAIASGIIGFVLSTAITSPYDESIKKVFDEKNIKKVINGEDGANLKLVRGNFKKMNERIKELEKLKESKAITDAAKEELENLMKKRAALDTLMHNAPDWVIGVPRAILTIALIPPILKYVFGIEKKKKKPPVEQTAQQQPKVEQKPELTPDFIQKPVFSAFKGGVK